MIFASMARWLLYVGAGLVVGNSALRWSGNGARVAHSRMPLVAWGAVLAAVGALLLAQARDMELEPTGSAWRMLLTQTTWGRHWCWLAATAVCGAAVALARPSTFGASRAGAVIAAVAAGGLAAAMGGLGHAAADEAYPIAVRVVDAMHVLTIGAWIGGLALMLLEEQRVPATIAAWRAFSAVATVAAPLAVFTGVVSAWRRLGLPPLHAGVSTPADVTSILGSSYAQLLLGKTVLVLIVLWQGQTHRRRLLQEQAPSGSTMKAELAFALLVLAVTSVLTNSAPPGE